METIVKTSVCFVFLWKPQQIQYFVYVLQWKPFENTCSLCCYGQCCKTNVFVHIFLWPTPRAQRFGDIAVPHPQDSATMCDPLTNKSQLHEWCIFISVWITSFSCPCAHFKINSFVLGFARSLGTCHPWDSFHNCWTQSDPKWTDDRSWVSCKPKWPEVTWSDPTTGDGFL